MLPSQVLNSPSARHGHLLTSYHGSLHPGQIVLFGGNYGYVFYNQIYILNPHATVANLNFYNWTFVAPASTTAPPPMTRAGGFVRNDALWIYGGLAAGNSVQNTLWSFNFATKIWTSFLSTQTGQTLPKPCYGCNLVFYDDTSFIRA